MTPGFRRWQTKRALDRALEKFGDFHPATFAAYARAFIAWGGRIRPPSYEAAPNRADLAAAYTTAQLRFYGDVGWNNRHSRRRALRAHLRLSARPIDATVADIMARHGARRAA